MGGRMNIKLLKADISKLKSDALVLGAYKGVKFSSSGKRFKGLKEIVKDLGFKGELGEAAIVPWRENYKNIIVVGLGEKQKLSEESIRTAAKKALDKAKSSKLKSVVSELLGEDKLKGLSAKAISEGFIIGNYEFNKYKEKKEEGKIEEITVISNEDYTSEFELGKILSLSVNYARNIANEPGNVVNPVSLSEIAVDLSKQYNLEIEVFDENRLKEEKMVGILSVGMGSKTPPRFIHICYKPKKPKKKVVVIGKGITFDSGGLNIKPEQFMKKMKSDKSGACAVLGIMKAIGELKPDIEVHGLIPAAENMPDGKAFRPDDIITFKNGKSVEIHSTDAEGRLILADALIYGSELKPDIMIDMATLTGACVVALGNYTSGLFTDDEKLSKLLLNLSERTGEKMWRLPLDPDLNEDIKGTFSDLQNVGKTRYGGAITAALFLKNFVGNDVKNWAHIDIAGPAFLDKPWKYYSAGATGQPVRTIVELIKGMEK